MTIHPCGIMVKIQKKEEKMPRIWLGLVFTALIAQPTSAQDYRKNFVECAKELGLQGDPSYVQKLQSEPGRVTRRWFFQSEHQQMAFTDCVARKARAGQRVAR
jgi:hypothetical protein